VKLTVLGGSGVWPPAGGACSGYLLEDDGFRLLIDPGYAVLPRLLEVTSAELLDAVVVSHGHPDHCADLNPLLRARWLREDRAGPLPIRALPRALDAVLALDRPGMLDDAYALMPFEAGASFIVGPFEVRTWPLPHFVANAGIRVSAGGRSLAYTGDSGPSPASLDLSRGVDLLLAESTFPDLVPNDSADGLSSARQRGELAVRAGVGHLMLTHVGPLVDPSACVDEAARVFDGAISVARPGMSFVVGTLD
jgi:ribonuclease BN (tRNA processing enzyme)